ncbi:MAG: hypothetical protein JWP97_4963 [Labilithrix sp.]|nr:hypothetical protein [Labilithrix sp.]
MTLLRRSLAPLALAAALVAFAGDASADPSAADLLLARNLANEGIALSQKGDCEGALVKLQRAEAIHHAPTILVHVGECQMKMGKLVDALSSLDRVAHENLGPQPPRAFVTAQDRAGKLVADLRPKLGTLRVDATGTRSGATFTLDNVELREASLGLDRPIDPGVHVIEATSANGVKTRREVKVAEGSTQTVTLALPVVKDPPPEAAPALATQAMPDDSRHANGWKPVGIALTATGAVALVTAGVLAGVTLSKKSDLDARCAEKACPPDAQSDYDSARTTATVSGIAAGVGVVALAAGVYVLVFKNGGKERSSSAHAFVTDGRSAGFTF